MIRMIPKIYRFSGKNPRDLYGFSRNRHTPSPISANGSLKGEESRAL
jgi:hypothetical protein